MVDLMLEGPAGFNRKANMIQEIMKNLAVLAGLGTLVLKLLEYLERRNQ